MGKSNELLKKVIIGSFVLVPILSSIISTLHLVDLFALGNPNWLAIALAITIEIGSVASFLTLSILSRLNKGIVWTVFIILFFMQLVGNMYFSYEWINGKTAADPNWINSFKEMTEFFLGTLDPKDIKMYLTILISWPIPLVSVFLLKSATDYIGNDAEPQPEPVVKEVEEEKPAEEEKKEISFYDLKAEDRERLRAQSKEDQKNNE